MSEQFRDVPLSKLPEIELLRVLEDIDSNAMGVEHRKSIPEDRQQPQINRALLAIEHPEYLGIKPPVNAINDHLPTNVIRQMHAGQLGLFDAFERKTK